jgi:imidazolonepropionase-like amidohydrolase
VGKLADVLVVDGDVLADIRLLEDRESFLAVMQGGVVKAGQLTRPSHSQCEAISDAT